MLEGSEKCELWTKASYKSWLVSEWSFSFQGLHRVWSLLNPLTAIPATQHSPLTAHDLSKTQVNLTSSSSYVWPWQGRQGPGQGRRQEAPQAAA